MTKQTKQYVKVGDRFTKRLPYSEVCMHMLIADKQMECELVSDWAVQLYDDAGRKFSSPITRGEAGIHRDDLGRLYYVEA